MNARNSFVGAAPSARPVNVWRTGEDHTFTTIARRPSRSRPARAIAARASGDPSYAMSTGPVRSAGLGTTSTGRVEWLSTLDEVEPSSERATPPRPREPHTITSASISSAAAKIGGHGLIPDGTAVG